MTTPAIIYLARGVRAYFTEHDITAKVFVSFGKERWKQINQGPATTGSGTAANRVVFVVGAKDGKGGKYGKQFGVRGPGGAPKYDLNAPDQPQRTGTIDPRPIISESGIFLVSTWATAEEDDTTLDGDTLEEKIIVAEQLLFENLVQAVQHTVFKAANWTEFEWNTEPKELRFGIERLSTLELAGVYYDRAPLPLVFPEGKVERGAVT